jgi:hypothetical protein
MSANRVSDFAYRCHACTIQVVIVLAGLNEQVVINVLVHLLTADEVVIAAVHLSVTTRACCVCTTPAFITLRPSF